MMRLQTLLLLGCALFAGSVSAFAQEAKAPLPQWIWLDKKAGDDQVVYFRKEFEAPANLTKATLVTTCDNKAQVLLNGQRSAVVEDWSQPVIEVVTDQVQAGKANVIAVRAQNEGGSAGFLLNLKLETQGGETMTVVSDETWGVSPKGEKGWNEAGFKPAKEWATATKQKDLGQAPYEKINEGFLAGLENLRQPRATPVDRLHVKDGFQVELLYSVPKEDQGSWVAMCADDKGRLIVSDQYGSLYRMTPPKPGEQLSPGDVEKIDVEIGSAQGLLYAFGSLYAVLNTNEFGGRGLYRVRDTDGDDKFDTKELLKKFEESGGEHGPHAVLLGPDGESLYVVCGNQTALPEYDHSRVPEVWQEDNLLPRIYGRGFMKGVEAPRGWIAKTDPDGKEWEIIVTGFRNEYDAAFNRDGELFAYDADMEWDMNTPWYRPTRVNHVISGAEFGWRNGSAKWPEYYSDSFGAVVNIGPGSPTGVSFGYGAKFPAKYQDALYICDWSYGKLYAVHLEPEGASYTGTKEEFIFAQPLPLTDVIIHPTDGAMYFSIGGRRVQSGLYRVTYVGDESTDPVKGEHEKDIAKRGERKTLESYHDGKDPKGMEIAWPYLSSEDRALRYAARVAVEHQRPEEWQEKALSESDDQAALAALIALARVGDKSLQPRAVAKLAGFDYGKLNHQQRLDLIRAYGLTFMRLGEPNDAQKSFVTEQLDAHFPAKTMEENIEISHLYTYLQAPNAAEKIVGLLEKAPTQEEQISYAADLRLLEKGWTMDLRRKYFEWFVLAQSYRGGASFGLFMEEIKNDALSRLSEEEKAALKDVIEKKAESTGPRFTFEPRSFTQAWKVEDFDDVINVGLEGGRNFENGRNMFGAATCFACHRFKQQGGAIGPDLTSVSGKFSPRDLLESVIEPSKEISDQYGSMVFTMLDGSVINGRIMNLSGDSVRVMVNMMNPDEIVSVDRKMLKEMKPSEVSMMPPGLLNTLSKDDVLDLLAYLLSAGNPEDPMFE